MNGLIHRGWWVRETMPVFDDPSPEYSDSKSVPTQEVRKQELQWKED